MGDSADHLQVLDYSAAVQQAFTAVAWVNSCVGMDVSSIYQVGGALDPPPRCLSQVGVPNALQKLARHELQSTLAISLHAPNQALREQIIPR